MKRETSVAPPHKNEGVIEKRADGLEGTGYIGQGCCIQHLVHSRHLLAGQNPVVDQKLLGPAAGVELDGQRDEREHNGRGKQG